MTSKSAQETLFTLPHRAHQGRTFVYVLRCKGEDLLKVGFSHDPISRFHALHPKFYNFFDLNESLLIETDRMKEARRLERLFIERWPEHRAPAPLTINPQAGGHTEWFRGVGDSITTVAERLTDRYGHRMYSPLFGWVRDRLLERTDLLFAWSERVYQIIDWQLQNQHALVRDTSYANSLRDALDAIEAVGIDSEPLVPKSVYQWYLAHRLTP